MPKYKLLVARFPYGGSEAMECTDWLMDLWASVKADGRFEPYRGRIADTPITMTRNDVLVQALKAGMDYVLMVDSDMAPDCELGADPVARPFWPTTMDFMLNHSGPSVVGAPYCGPPPHENIYVFQWSTWEAHHPNVDARLEQYTREQAAVMSGIGEVAALPTGLIVFDMRAFRDHPYPYTYYEWEGDGAPCKECGQRKPGPQAKKCSTEDVTLTRDLSMRGIPMYCNWDAWAGHVKRKIVRKPRLMGPGTVAGEMRKSVLLPVKQGESMVEIRASRFQEDIDRALAKHGRGAAEHDKSVKVKHQVEVANGDIIPLSMDPGSIWG